MMLAVIQNLTVVMMIIINIFKLCRCKLVRLFCKNIIDVWNYFFVFRALDKKYIFLLFSFKILVFYLHI